MIVCFPVTANVVASKVKLASPAIASAPVTVTIVLLVEPVKPTLLVAAVSQLKIPASVDCRILLLAG